MTTKLQEPMTVWDDPEETIISGYGNIDYREWCELEMARFNSGGSDNVKIVDHPDGLGRIALSR